MRKALSMTSVRTRPNSTQGRLAAVAVKEMMALQQEARLLNPASNQPKWSQIFRVHWVDYVTLVVLVTSWMIMEEMHPFQRVIYGKDDLETWRYSYPLKPNTVPAIAVPALAAGGPVVVFVVYYFAFRCSRHEFHNLVIGLLTNVFAAAAVTNFIKLNVGRPRPSFVSRCWPSGTPAWDAHGMPLCTGNAADIIEGMKSFPSGHTAWSASGLGFLAFFLWGKTKAFDGSGHPTRLVAGMLPLLMALWIGLTRIQDYWHHWEDVTVGYALGITMAYWFYRALYPPLTSSRSDLPSSLYHAPRSHYSDHGSKPYSGTDAREREKRAAAFGGDAALLRRSESGVEPAETTPLMSTNV